MIRNYYLVRRDFGSFFCGYDCNHEPVWSDAVINAKLLSPPDAVEVYQDLSWRFEFKLDLKSSFA